jgi:phosphatidylserine decarboxylase
LKIHREGYPFIALFAAVNLLAFLLSAWLGWLLLPVTIWCVAFFRDPERKTPQEPGLIICPADGKLLPIVDAVPPAELGMGEMPAPRLSIFMNVFNVHVNRNPVSGHVIALSYRPANSSMPVSTRPASITSACPSACAPREKRETRDLAVVQIAGLVARRIVCDLAQGEGVRRGEDLALSASAAGLMSILPPRTEILVQPESRRGPAKPCWPVFHKRDSLAGCRPLFPAANAPRQIVARGWSGWKILSIGKLVPSTITLLALCSGVTAIRFGLGRANGPPRHLRIGRHDPGHAGSAAAARHAGRRQPLSARSSTAWPIW